MTGVSIAPRASKPREVSSNAASFFASGLKGRAKEASYEDHVALTGTYRMTTPEGGALVDRDVALRKALLEAVQVRTSYIAGARDDFAPISRMTAFPGAVSLTTARCGYDRRSSVQVTSPRGTRTKTLTRATLPTYSTEVPSGSLQAREPLPQVVTVTSNGCPTRTVSGAETELFGSNRIHPS